MSEKDMLIAKAWEERERAYVPYSGFKVGAAILGEDGNVYLGVNIENASYGATVCAERSALFSMVSAGCRKFKAIAVVADFEEDGAPCAMCRQVMTEFCADLDVPIYFGIKDRTVYTHTVREVVPFPVLPGSLEGNEIK